MQSYTDRGKEHKPREGTETNNISLIFSTVVF